VYTAFKGKPKLIALMIDRRGAYASAITRGIRQYADQVGNWQCIAIDPDPDVIPTMKKHPPDGVLGTFLNAAFARSVRKLRKPAVELSDWHEQPFCPRVLPDNHAVGRLAADYFVGRGLNLCGFVGPLDVPWARDRFEGFSEKLAESNITPLCCDPTKHAAFGWEKMIWCAPTPGLESWIRKVPKPIGILGANDQFGYSVLNAANAAELHVPDQVAVLGVDNDVLFCEMARPALSSIAISDVRIGYEAAALLDQLMAGETISKSILRVGGSQVVVRQSSDVVAVPDTDVADAIRFIRENATKGISVADVLAKVPIPRRTLERRFRAAIQRSPQEEISRMRIEHAQMLIRTTDLPLKIIAERAGFASAADFSRAFGGSVGTSPRQYRQQFYVA
jgi:LacI family transcriptional regulator